ncbi:MULTISPECIES: BREX-1 system adenine-specific DNA-methyltransferase PglX [Winogradskyella]|uniref:BREX-1 system adenine-specific DNA-methyltransferase PglX n=1 Tax=Winogradskyella TaxID=286104 RepID=UPI0015C762ED|nr:MULTISPECIES: BREX-1 system adenine-specific DNA-methyltransferase PglX [Winogradskyella]QXP79827.1 BREX-1 system adenine-specific DNA-methyltransferase PglX [Winogradskyella sp. HaHa_3_26]
MNTNQLKRFAQDARIKLIDQIGAKLEKVLTTDSVALREKAGHLQKLQQAINKTSKADVIDTVAYTWFNRFVALRFMDVNGYQPIAVSIVSPVEGGTLPAILQEAKQGVIPEELPVQQQHVYEVLDGTIPSTDAQNEAYADLLVGACNHLSETLPFLFEKIDDYAELLLPDDLISQFSILQDVRDGMTAEDCAEVEIIGWLYQFYISEKKDEVFASKGKVKKEDIPAATQLFTPRWIVEYMVQNTVGKLWLQNNPKSKLREHMPYFIESPSVTEDDYLTINSVEDITLLDPACGSGHILVYGFELLSKIYEEQGYNESEIPKLIIEKNLHGFEIDTRAAQLAGLVLMLRARQYYRRVFKKDINPNIFCYQDLKVNEEEINATFAAIDETLSDALLFDLKTIQQATNLGSLIIPQTNNHELNNVLEVINNKVNTNDIFLKQSLTQIKEALNQLVLLSKKYLCVVANPPYMGDGKMNSYMSGWVKSNYPLSKSDLFACFIERSLNFVPKRGFNGLVTMESWMFLSSFEKLRNRIIKDTKIHSLSHFGWNIMRIAFGTVSFVLENKKPKEGFRGIYSYMNFNNINKQKEKPIQFPVMDNGRYKITNQNDFSLLPGTPFAYWLSESVVSLFQSKNIAEYSISKAGIVSGNDAQLLRFWQEVGRTDISFNEDVFRNKNKLKYVPINKGGEWRKYFGNQDYIINIHKLWDGVSTTKSVRRGDVKFYFKEAINWSYISNTNYGFRKSKNVVFGTQSPSVFVHDNVHTNYLLGFLNSNICKLLLPAINPTVSLVTSNIECLPVIFSHEILLKVNDIVESQFASSRNDWNSREISWDFQQNELIRIKGQDLQQVYDVYCKYWQNKFFELHRNEEELNRQFIDIYGLQDELTPEVPLEDITILKEETTIKDGQLVFRESEIMAQLISYAVGCMFGRYSLDKQGLILANQGETLETYLENLQASNSKFKALEDLTFVPDDDNVIPILDNEWFEDDIVGRFYAFLKATFGTQHFNKNLAFVEDAVGDIRKYFLKTFYNDHWKRYKKRPIYWMFSSPTGAFNALIYMHRYTPDTLNTVLNGYLKEYQEKLKAQNQQLDHVKNVGTDREKVSAEKEQARLNKVLLELQEYDRELFKIATERIAIDLDDGVLVNYNKFGNVIKTVSGLNDKKAKDKVRKFDWIDVTEIQ